MLCDFDRTFLFLCLEWASVHDKIFQMTVNLTLQQRMRNYDGLSSALPRREQ